jgi:hypothetical protein
VVDAAQEGAFPGAGRAEQANHFASVDLKIDPLQDLIQSKAFVDILGTDQCCGVHGVAFL